MPYKDPDPSDPNVLVGVVLPADANATRDMAYVFAEEFARLGYSREQLLWLFKNPFYGGAHGAYRHLGESEVLSIIDECLAAWGNVQFSILDFDSSIEPPPSSPGSRGRKTCPEPRRREAGDSDEFAEKSKIGNLKSKMEEGGGSDG